jgi:hypothetical protein
MCRSCRKRRILMVKPIEQLRLGPTRSVEEVDDNLYVVTVTPPEWTGITEGKSIELTRNQFERYREWLVNSEPIQNVFPDLTADQREILLTGL